MELNDFSNINKSNTEEEEEEEILLLERLVALRKQLEDDDKTKLHQTTYNSKENVTNKNIISLSKFKYRKINRLNINNKYLPTKTDNHIFSKNQNEIKENNIVVKTNNSSSNVLTKLNSTSIQQTLMNKKNCEVLNNSYHLEIDKIVKNSHIKNSNSIINKNCRLSDVSLTLLNIDEYMINVQDYLTSSKYIVSKEDPSTLSTNNHVHINRKFQNQLLSNSFLNSNLKNPSNSIVSIKKLSNLNKKKPLKKLNEKLIQSPNLIKIGNTKLVRQSLFRNKWKINNKQNSIYNDNVRKPLSTLQCPTNTFIASYKKTKWTKVNNPPLILKSELSNSNINKLKWTKPNILLVNNVNRNTNNNNKNYSLDPKSDKLILFGKNKIIRQSLISSIQSKTKNYLLKHLSHRFALIRKLQQKNNTPKIKTITNSNESAKNSLLLKKPVNKPVEIKNNVKKSYSMYSYVNPKLRSKTNNFSLEKTKFTDVKISPSIPISNNKSILNLKTVNNNINKIQNINLTNNTTLERFRNKKVLTKQLCLVFNRFGICSALDQNKCDKRHYKKFIILCTKFLIGECSNMNCELSHNIIEEKIPFCKHYLNSVCVQLNCPYLHEYRDKSTPICKKFIHGYCTLAKKCPKKHLNLCPIFEIKNKCPHGLKCLYPHVQCEEKNNIVEIQEPRYFETTIPNNEESNENKFIHIVPNRHAQLMDLPSYIPL